MGKPEPAVKKAVFLDRDGVLNIPPVRDGKPSAPFSLEDFKLYPDALEACRALKKAGFFLIVATNQPEVSRGNLKKEVVEAMHREMQRLLPIDDIEVSYASGHESQPDPMRKPAPGMLLRAAAKHKIDLSQSYMVGDRWRDVDCGAAAGCATIFIDRGYAEPLRKTPDATVANLKEAAAFILKREQ